MGFTVPPAYTLSSMGDSQRRTVLGMSTLCCQYDVFCDPHGNQINYIPIIFPLCSHHIPIVVGFTFNCPNFLVLSPLYPHQIPIKSLFFWPMPVIAHTPKYGSPVNHARSPTPIVTFPPSADLVSNNVSSAEDAT